MDDLGVDADDQRQVVARRRDVLGGPGQRGPAAELLETDEVREPGAQLEEQVGPRLESVVRAVVDHGSATAVRRPSTRRNARAAPPPNSPSTALGESSSDRRPPLTRRAPRAQPLRPGSARRFRRPRGFRRRPSRSTPRRRSSPDRSAQSPIDPQYTTPVIPAAINCPAVATSASWFTLPSPSHGVISAGRQPWNTFEFTGMQSKTLSRQAPTGPAPRADDDVVVIGAGIIGLSVALEVAGRGRRVVLVDRGPIDGGLRRRQCRAPRPESRHPARRARCAVERGRRPDPARRSAFRELDHGAELLALDHRVRRAAATAGPSSLPPRRSATSPA